jgi:serine/threonine protein kinase
MGTKQSNPVVKDKSESTALISKNHFDFMYVIGRGGFGKVWKVYYKKYKRAYALKVMSKGKIIDKKSERSIKYEKELLSKMNHPYYMNNN